MHGKTTPAGTMTLDALVNRVDDNPAALARLAHAVFSHGDKERARALCERALSLAPDDGEVRALTSEIFTQDVPAWYFPMVLDRARNRLYEEAIRRTVRPGDLVLEIGAGTGLMTMMAARAGGKVVACDPRSVVADVANEIVARNGLADRVTLFPKLSVDLAVGKELDRPADVVVWDNLSNNLIGAGALPAVEHAARDLARPGARFIPARGGLRIALADDLEQEFVRMGTVEGFDLSAFNRLSPVSYEISTGSRRFVLRSGPTDLFRFDFEGGGPFPEARTELTLTASGGRVSGVVQWIRLQLDDLATHENHPPIEKTSALYPVFYPFHRSVELKPGETLKLHASHDRQSVRIWAELPK